MAFSRPSADRPGEAREGRTASQRVDREQMADSSGSTARRRFLAGAAAAGAGGLALLAPLWSGLRVALDPLRRRRGEAGFVRVTTLSALPDDGAPRKFPVVASRVDAWNTFASVPVGAVYLRRLESGGGTTQGMDDGPDAENLPDAARRSDAAGVKAFNVVCPHAGCFVTLAADRSRFVCPCHKSSFGLDGAVNDPSSPSPRGLDALDVEVRDGGEVWVRFQNFRPGTPNKTPVA